MKLTHEEEKAFIDVFGEVTQLKSDEVNLRDRILKPFLLLMLIFVATLMYIDVFRAEVIQHYSYIYSITETDAVLLLRAKAMISLICVGTFVGVFVYGKGITMISLGFLIVLLNGFLDDFTARLATAGVVFDMKMNVILSFRLAMIAILGRISYICINRKSI